MKYLLSLLSLAVAAAWFAPAAPAQTVVNSWFATTFAGGLEYDPATDTVWVVDETTDRILQFTRAGTQLQSLPAPIPPGSTVTTPQPIGIGIDPATGNLWVGDEAEFVYEMDATGATTGVSWSTTPAVVDVSGAAVDAATGNVYVSQDSGTRVIVEFTQAGTAVRTIPLAGAGSTDPDGLGYNPVKLTWYLGEDTGDLIIEVDAAGTAVQSWAVGPLGISPEGVGVDTANGRMFISDGVNDMVFEVAGIVPPGGPQLAVTNLVAGATATVSVTGATPLGTVGVAYSLVGPGPTAANAGPCGTVTVDLSPPVVVLPLLTADTAGTVSVNQNVPGGATGLNVWLHALDVGSCTLTNSVAAVIG